MFRSKLIASRRAAANTETIVIVSLIAIFCIGIFTLFGHQIVNTTAYIINRFSGKQGMAGDNAEFVSMAHLSRSEKLDMYRSQQIGSMRPDSPNPEEAAGYNKFKHTDANGDGAISASEFVNNFDGFNSPSSGLSQADTSANGSARDAKQQLARF